MSSRLEKLKALYKKELLERGLSANAPIESVRELARKFNCSPTTAGKILQHLADEDMLYPIPGKGYFFRHTAARKQKIGYLGTMPSPLLDPIAYDAATGLLDHLENQHEYEIIVLQFRAMQKFDIASKLLQSLDGLLLQACYIDSQTLPALRQFSKPIVLFGAQYQNDQLICNQVIADFSTAIKELFQYCEPDKYKKIVIMQTRQKNSEATARQIINYLSISDLNIPIEIEETNEPAGYGNIMYGYERIKNLAREEAENTLFIALSGFISKGMYLYSEKNNLPPENLPDIISVDNFESYENDPDHSAFFTAIDRSSKECYIQASELLFSELRSPSHRRVILQIPTKLIIRKSIKSIKQTGENQ